MGNQTSQEPIGKVLWEAVRHDDIKTAQGLLSRGLRARELIEYRDAKYGMTPLMVAARGGNSTLVGLFVRLGADLNARDTIDGNTALHFAAYKNRPVVIRLLLSAECNPHTWNNQGRTALDVARVRQRHDAVRILTSRLMIHEGWLYCRKHATGLSSWTKRWCRVFRCSPTGDRLEVATFAFPSEIQPRKMFVLNPSEHTIRTVPKKSLWSDRANMFEFNQSIVFQRLSDKGFSRSQAHHQSKNEIQREFCFAAESKEALQKWIQLFHSQPESPVPSAPMEQPEIDEDQMLPPSAPSFEMNNNESPEPECVVCMDANRNAVCVPCGHYAACYDCLAELQLSSGCPICRRPLASIVRLYNC